MKKKLFLTAGILIGMGSLYGAKHWFAPGSVEAVTSGRQLVLPSTLRTTEKAQAEAVGAQDPLEAKIEQLRRWASGQEPGMSRETAMKLLEEWAARDASAALDFVSTAPHIPRRNFAYAIPLARICRNDPKAGIAWLVQQIEVAGDRDQIAELIIRRIKDESPIAALELTRAPGISIDRDDFGELLGRVARTQPQIALQAFAQMRPDDQSRAIGPLLYQWAQTHPTEALGWYQGRGEIDADDAQSLASGCMKSGRCTLADLVSRLKLDTKRADRMLWQLCREGVVLDSSTLGLFSERARQRAAAITAQNLEDSPDRVLAFVKASVGANHQAEALLDGWNAWLNSDRQAALAWVQQLPDRQLASELAARLERQEQLRDPHKALVAAGTIANQEERKAVVASAIQRLLWQDPGVVAAWLVNNPNDAPRSEMFSQLAQRYLERDDAGAMAWIAGLSAGEARDDALSAAASFWVGTEIDFATTSMAVIGNAQKRQQCMFNLYRNLCRKDAAKADEWLAIQGLSAEVRQSWKVLGQTTSSSYCE